MSWLQVLGIVLKVALVLADVVREHKQMAASEASATLKALEATNARVEKARAARRAAAVRGLPDDDLYLRD
jgi:hypothetical protein